VKYWWYSWIFTVRFATQTPWHHQTQALWRRSFHLDESSWCLDDRWDMGLVIPCDSCLATGATVLKNNINRAQAPFQGVHMSKQMREQNAHLIHLHSALLGDVDASLLRISPFRHVSQPPSFSYAMWIENKHATSKKKCWKPNKKWGIPAMDSIDSGR